LSYFDCELRIGDIRSWNLGTSIRCKFHFDVLPKEPRNLGTYSSVLALCTWNPSSCCDVLFP